MGVFTAGEGNTNEYRDASDLRAHYVGIMGAKSACDPNAAATQYPENGYRMLLRNEGTGASGGLGGNGMIVVDGGVSFRKVVDGSSNTMMLGECAWDSGPTRTWIVGTLDHNSYGAPGASQNHGWIYNAKNVMWPMHTAFREAPNEPYSGYNSNDVSLGSKHTSGANVAMGDASTRFVSDDIDLAALKAMATRDNEDNLDPPLTCTGAGPPPPPPR